MLSLSRTIPRQSTLPCLIEFSQGGVPSRFIPKDVLQPSYFKFFSCKKKVICPLRVPKAFHTKDNRGIEMPQSRFVIEICDKWTGCELLLGTKGLVRQAARSLKFFMVFVFFFVCLFVYLFIFYCITNVCL